MSTKEMIATEGVPGPLGTAAGDMTAQPNNAPPVARFREAGATVIREFERHEGGTAPDGKRLDEEWFSSVHEFRLVPAEGVAQV